MSQRRNFSTRQTTNREQKGEKRKNLNKVSRGKASAAKCEKKEKGKAMQTTAGGEKYIFVCRSFETFV
jgi:hypothetical protein